MPEVEQSSIGGWILSAKPRSTSISPDRGTVWSFDLEGRPISWFAGGRLHKRSLRGDVHLRERVAGARQRRLATDAEAEAMLAELHEHLAGVPHRGLSPNSRARVEDALGWPPARLLAERERFDATYRPIGILPPDRYVAVVLQATLGCSWNRCTFCDFYRDRDFEVRSATAFGQHVAAVQRLLGRDAARRRSIFLADGNALMLSNRRLLPLVDAARAAFPGRAIDGFVDVCTGERKPRADWEELRAHGLCRVHVGLETGHDELLAWLNKPGSAAAAEELVVTLKAAGLRVAVIFMVGAGGERFAGPHERDTVALATRLPLGAGDLVYLSPFRDHASSAHSRRAATAGLRPLTDAECETRCATLRDRLRAVLPDVTVARYDVRELVY